MSCSKSLTVPYPHIYKKGKILNFKKLDEGIDPTSRKYVFSTANPSVANVINSTNNINQIVGRNWIGISKLLSYFGLSKDQSEKSSKPKVSTFNKFWYQLQKDIEIDLSKYIKLLKDLNAKVDRLEASINNLENFNIEPQVTESEIHNLTTALNKIQDQLNRVIGE
ncbi:hypothetical protein Tco_0696353 [Tanacetum coccineum]